MPCEGIALHGMSAPFGFQLSAAEMPLVLKLTGKREWPPELATRSIANADAAIIDARCLAQERDYDGRLSALGFAHRKGGRVAGAEICPGLASCTPLNSKSMLPLCEKLLSQAFLSGSCARFANVLETISAQLELKNDAGISGFNLE